MKPTPEALLLQYEVEQFYYHEAALLDERRFDEWLDLLTPDIHYWMPIRRTVTIANADREFTKPGDMAFFDDDKRLLEARVRKLASGYSWSEDPPSRTRHMISQRSRRSRKPETSSSSSRTSISIARGSTRKRIPGSAGAAIACAAWTASCASPSATSFSSRR